ncbi:rRNA biogenesis protein rrp5 [Aerococcaceae bacterium NML190073]|nr:rRNA biogenesis protein rrp5 [Aerococcaceae bacterium NML190073]
MNKAKLILDVAQLMLKVVQDLRSLSDSVQAVCEAVTEGLSEEQVQEQKAIEAKPVQGEKPAVSLEKVRSVLAEKSQTGHTAEVRAIIQKYGASRLSDIDAKDYAAVLKDAEELN